MRQRRGQMRLNVCIYMCVYVVSFWGERGGEETLSNHFVISTVSLGASGQHFITQQSLQETLTIKANVPFPTHPHHTTPPTPKKHKRRSLENTYSHTYRYIKIYVFRHTHTRTHVCPTDKRESKKTSRPAKGKLHYQ